MADVMAKRVKDPGFMDYIKGSGLLGKSVQRKAQEAFSLGDFTITPEVKAAATKQPATQQIVNNVFQQMSSTPNFFSHQKNLQLVKKMFTNISAELLTQQGKQMSSMGKKLGQIGKLLPALPEQLDNLQARAFGAEHGASLKKLISQFSE